MAVEPELGVSWATRLRHAGVRELLATSSGTAIVVAQGASIYLIDASTSKIRSKLHGSSAGISSVAVLASGGLRELVAGSTDGFLKFWHLESLEETCSTFVPLTPEDIVSPRPPPLRDARGVACVSCSAGSSQVVGAAHSRCISVFGPGGEHMHTLPLLDTSVRMLCWAGSDVLIAISGQTIHTWTISQGRVTAGPVLVGQPVAQLTHAVASPDGSLIAAMTSNMVHIWRLNQPQQRQASAHNVVASGESSVASDITASGDGTAIDTPDEEHIQKPVLPEFTCKGPKGSAASWIGWDSSSRFVAAAFGNELHVWDTQAKRWGRGEGMVCVGFEPGTMITGAAFQPDGPLLAAVSSTGRVLVFDTSHLAAVGDGATVYSCSCGHLPQMDPRGITSATSPRTGRVLLAWHGRSLLLANDAGDLACLKITSPGEPRPVFSGVTDAVVPGSPVPSPSGASPRVATAAAGSGSGGGARVQMVQSVPALAPAPVTGYSRARPSNTGASVASSNPGSPSGAASGSAGTQHAPAAAAAAAAAPATAGEAGGGGELRAMGSGGPASGSFAGHQQQAQHLQQQSSFRQRTSNSGAPGRGNGGRRVSGSGGRGFGGGREVFNSNSRSASFGSEDRHTPGSNPDSSRGRPAHHQRPQQMQPQLQPQTTMGYAQPGMHHAGMAMPVQAAATPVAAAQSMGPYAAQAGMVPGVVYQQPSPLMPTLVAAPPAAAMPMMRPMASGMYGAMQPVMVYPPQAAMAGAAPAGMQPVYMAAPAPGAAHMSPVAPHAMAAAQMTMAGAQSGMMMGGGVWAGAPGSPAVPMYIYPQQYSVPPGVPMAYVPTAAAAPGQYGMYMYPQQGAVPGAQLPAMVQVQQPAAAAMPVMAHDVRQAAAGYTGMVAHPAAHGMMAAAGARDQHAQHGGGPRHQQQQQHQPFARVNSSRTRTSWPSHGPGLASGGSGASSQHQHQHHQQYSNHRQQHHQQHLQHQQGAQAVVHQPQHHDSDVEDCGPSSGPLSEQLSGPNSGPLPAKTHLDHLKHESLLSGNSRNGRVAPAGRSSSESGVPLAESPGMQQRLRTLFSPVANRSRNNSHSGNGERRNSAAGGADSDTGSAGSARRNFRPDASFQDNAAAAATAAAAAIASALGPKVMRSSQGGSSESGRESASGVRSPRPQSPRPQSPARLSHASITHEAAVRMPSPLAPGLLNVQLRHSQAAPAAADMEAAGAAGGSVSSSGELQMVDADAHVCINGHVGWQAAAGGVPAKHQAAAAAAELQQGLQQLRVDEPAGPEEEQVGA